MTKAIVAEDEKVCPFCRAPTPKSKKEMIEWTKKRMEAGDARAIYSLGCYYSDGMYGLLQDHTKALELFHQAGKLGFAQSYGCIGYEYNNGENLQRDTKKSIHYYELAAMGGCEVGRLNLGMIEARAGNMNRALKHCMIAIAGGNSESVNQIKRMYGYGFATKDDYTKALQSYQAYLDEIKSDQRDKAAAYHGMYRYY